SFAQVTVWHSLPGCEPKITGRMPVPRIRPGRLADSTSLRPGSQSRSFSLTPAFRPVIIAEGRHQPFQRLTIGSDVRAFLLPLLGSSNLGNLEPRKAAGRRSCG